MILASLLNGLVSVVVVAVSFNPSTIVADASPTPNPSHPPITSSVLRRGQGTLPRAQASGIPAKYGRPDATRTPVAAPSMSQPSNANVRGSNNSIRTPVAGPSPTVPLTERTTVSGNASDRVPRASPTPTTSGSVNHNNETLPIAAVAAAAAAAIFLSTHHHARATTDHSQATSTEFPVTIYGTVSKNGVPVAGASIELQGSRVALRTSRRSLVRSVPSKQPGSTYSDTLAYQESDKNGQFVLSVALRQGLYRLHVSAVGTAVEGADVTVRGTATFVRNFALHGFIGAQVAYATRSVYYVTEHTPTGTGAAFSFEGKPTIPRRLSYGVVAVSVPHPDMPIIHGSKLTHFADSGGHLLVGTPVVAPQQTGFFAQLRAETAASSSHTILLFVHGFNQTFEQAVRAAAQLRAGLKVDAPAIVYDWPSRGKLRDYGHDEDIIRDSGPFFFSFVQQLANELPNSNIELVAHSMGNRLVADLIEGGPEGSGTKVRLDHVVMAAPDVDTSGFFLRLRYIQKTAGRISIYASSSDQALLASLTEHDDPRLGYFIQMPTNIYGIDTIDATDVDTSILGHGYFNDDRCVLSDIRGTLANKSPTQRGLRLHRIDANDFWWILGPSGN